MENSIFIQSDFRKQLKLISLIGLGMFLYVLFFQPFNIQAEELNDKLVLILGVAVINVIILGLFRIIIPRSVIGHIRIDSLSLSNEVALILLIWFFLSTANICYLFFIADVDRTLNMGVRISIFSAIPSLSLKLADVINSLQDQLRIFARRNLKLEHDLAQASQTVKKAVVLPSDSQNDNLEVYPEDIMLVKSADNYVEVIYRVDQEIKRKLLRNTMKNIQTVLSEHDEFIRCHRTSLVNTTYILNMTNSYRGHRLQLLDFEEEIPVSRQYILNIKELIESI